MFASHWGHLQRTKVLNEGINRNKSMSLVRGAVLPYWLGNQYVEEVDSFRLYKNLSFVHGDVSKASRPEMEPICTEHFPTPNRIEM